MLMFMIILSILSFCLVIGSFVTAAESADVLGLVSFAFFSGLLLFSVMSVVELA